MRLRLALLFLLVGTGACAQEPADAPAAPAGADPAVAEAAVAEAAVADRVERALAAGISAAEARADSVVAALLPVPLLRTSEQRALLQYPNDQHVARARALGVRPGSEAELERLLDEGRLVRLADSTAHWVVRELDHSRPFVTPDVVALLTEIGERFQAELAAMGLPPYRLEVSSALRTAEAQADLRASNANAARGTSAHEFGTTVDVAYESFAAPTEPVVAFDTDAAPWLAPHLRRIADTALERAAAQKSRELQAILGRLLREIQSEGKVLVTLEERQPVYHMTVNQRF